jgi:hypothetical protein
LSRRRLAWLDISRIDVDSLGSARLDDSLGHIEKPFGSELLERSARRWKSVFELSP